MLIQPFHLLVHPPAQQPVNCSSDCPCAGPFCLLQLRAHQDAVRKLERRLAEEVSRSAAVLHGAGIEALGLEDLEALGRVHEQVRWVAGWLQLFGMG
jgi:hypothetical protein